jgi:hypothetical protein
MAVICKLGRGKAIRMTLMLVAVAVFGGMCVYDGWFNPIYQPGGEKHKDLMFNQSMAVVCGIGTVVLAGLFVVAAKRKLVADDAGIDLGNGTRIAWADLTAADDSKYDKGFVRLSYTAGDEEKTYLMDNQAITMFDELLDEISTRRPDLLPPVDDTDAPAAKN